MQDKILKASKLLEKRASQVQRGGARAAVLGVNDGLVSILCIVIGVAAAGGDNGAVLLAGFAGTLAGAISMAAGEWISVTAQVELFAGVLKDLRKINKKDQALLISNLANNFEHHGIDSALSQKISSDVARDSDLFVSMYASQVIGINQDELGSPSTAAASSFVLFVIGAIAPMAPWVFGASGGSGIFSAIFLTALGGLFVGGFTAYSSGKSMVYGAVRQLIIIAFASAITYGIGYIFGVAVS